MNQFIFSTDECLILRAISQSSSLREAAKRLRCDPSGLLRKVQTLSQSELKPVEKINGKWHLSEKGHRLLNWTEEAIRTQNEVLNEKINLKIASTLWLSEEFLIPNFQKLKFPKNEIAEINFTCPTSSFEESLMNLDIDIVIACHPPENPAVAHKRSIKEEWIIAVPFEWKNKIRNRKESLAEFLSKMPYLRHQKINPQVLLPQIESFNINKNLSTDQLILIRSAIKNNLGWSLIPKILVSNELQKNELLEVDLKPKISNTICLWWLRERKDISKRIMALNHWLKTI